MEFGKPTTVKTALGPVEYLGQGSGPAVICIHGAMGGYDQSMALGLAIGQPGYRYIAVSRPGYLGTPMSSGKSPEQQADLHAALLDSLGLSDAIVMAISGGGPSAMYFALCHPNRCKKLILCNTVGGPAVQNIPFFFNIMMLLAKLKPFSDSLRKKTEANLKASVSRSITFPDLLEKVMEDSETMEIFKVVLLDSFNRMGDRIAGTKNDIRISSSFSCDLEKISVPTLVIHGTHDPLVPFADHGKQLAERIPGAKLCLGERGEHTTIFTHREQVRKAVREFLAQ